MENATKALLMAAGVLMGILILSLAVYLFIDFGQKAENINEQITSNQLLKFNAQFNVYEGRDDITIYEIISLVNLANQNNENYGSSNVFETDYKIDIYLGGVCLTNSSMTEQDKLDKINQYNGVKSVSDPNGEVEIVLEKTFRCESVEYHTGTTNRVSAVRFREN